MSAERSAALVRRWVAMYTLGLPPEARRDRRDEIDDDLWCQAQEAATASGADRSLAGEMIARLVFGVPSDLSWRIEQHRFGKARPRPVRSHAMNTRTTAALALVGGASWPLFFVLSIPSGLLEGRDQGDPLPLVALIVGGTLAMVFATIGLVAAAHDMISGSAATLAIVGALVATTVVFGWAVVAVGPALSSALVVWQLGRVGALPAWTSRVHVVAALMIVVGIALGFASPVFGQYGVLLLVPGAVYAFTWMAIGWALWRDPSAATDGVAGASPA